MYRSVIYITLLVLWCHPIYADGPRDGKRFDPGLAMSSRAKGAPQQLDRMAFYIGQWNVAYRTFPTDSTAYTAQATAHVTYMNRGHGIMERLHASDHDGNGNALDTIWFLAYQTTGDQWGLGEANSVTEHVTVYNGGFERPGLVLHNAVRRQGRSTGLTLYKMRMIRKPSDRFEVAVETSNDNGKTWRTTLIKSYTRRTLSADFMKPSDTYGVYAPDLPEESRAFDFLIGTYNAAQEITLANGRVAKFPSQTTAVFALNGHAILEYNWYDVDTSLPDAATSIIRIYNRAMRRWESLYITNRGNGLLYFGGKQEGDRIILHNFETDTGNPINYYVFHSVAENGYKWYAETSGDRGKTFTKTWTIELTRKE